MDRASFLRVAHKVNVIEGGITTGFLNTNIAIRFGRIEEVSKKSEDSLVVLPANEFFDDECINDRKSALGAYINARFINQTEKIERIIKDELQKNKSVRVEKETGVYQESYGVGSSIFMRNPIGSKQPILAVSVTTKQTRGRRIES